MALVYTPVESCCGVTSDEIFVIVFVELQLREIPFYHRCLSCWDGESFRDHIRIADVLAGDGWILNSTIAHFCNI